jgi:death-on-curing protein
MYRFCSGHFFNDGNKRIALTLGTYFLHKNNYFWHACTCMRTLESIIYHVAASNIEKELFIRIIESFMSNKDYDEDLKIDIANAINKK